MIEDEEKELSEEGQGGEEGTEKEPIEPPEPDSYEFDLVFLEKPVTLRKDGVVTEYVLRELSGLDRDKFTSLMSKRAHVGADGKPVGKIDPSGLEQKLLGMCLYEKPTNKLVPESTIVTFPGRVQAALFSAAVKMNGLDSKAEKRAKKPLSAKS